jgi:hypothetical protein
MEAARRGAFDEAEFAKTLLEPSDIQVPPGAYGQPGRTVSVPGLRSTLAEQVKSKQAERARTVTPEAASFFGEGFPAGEYDEDVLTPMAAGLRQREERKSIESEGRKNRATQIEVAKIYAGAQKGAGFGGDMAAEGVHPIVAWARKINTGQATLSQLAQGKDGKHRDAVVKYMADHNMGIMTPTIQAKLTQYNKAKASIAKIRKTFNAIQEAESFSERAGATLQLNAEVKGLSRNIGRSQGETGVFTDADKLDFANIIQPGGGGIGTSISANFAPDFARGRLDSLDEFIESIRQREFTGFEELTGDTLATEQNRPSAGAGPVIGTERKKRRINPATGEFEE